jgi:hypothetical protein
VDNSPFLKLAIEEVRQTVTDAVQGGEIVLEEELEPESSALRESKGMKRGK